MTKSISDALKNIEIMSVELTEDLAEFVGILTGDGGIYKHARGGTTVEISSGKDDFLYMENHVRILIKRLFDKEVRVKDRNRRNEIKIVICSVPIAHYLHENFGLPYGAKKNISVPECIKNSMENIKCAFIRGLFDTDFCFRTVKKDYPIIQADFKSSKLVLDLEQLLFLIGITGYVKTNIERSYKDSSWITNRIQISGRKNLERWMCHISSNNPKHLRKIQKCMGVQGLAAIEKPLLLSNPGPLA